MKQVGGTWRSWFGRSYPDGEVVEAVHKNETQPRGWHSYTEAQIAATQAAARVIIAEYGLKDILGHDDISPGRKTDPGPAFPMESFRASIFGRDEEEPEDFVTTTVLNIREGPGTGFDKLPEAPLATGTRLRLDSRQGVWCFVEVLDAEETPIATGWVHGKFIAPA